MVEKALKWARAERQTSLEQLIEFLTIPSISAEMEHKLDIIRSADWLARHMRAIGLRDVEVYDTDLHPIVYGEWKEADAAPTILVYGHYDVQPTDPLDMWHTPPFSPTVQDDHLYARGASDDKGQLFIHLKAFEAFIEAADRVPVNVKFLLEGEEEIGSPDLEAFITTHQDKLDADVALISDSYILAPNQPSLVYGLRGICYIEIALQGPEQTLHSGSFGGAIHNPAEVLCNIISSLKDDKGHITIPGFYDRVRPPSPAERAELARVPFNVEDFEQETGVSQTWGEEGYSVLEQITARPTLEVNGLVSGYTGEGGKTIIPSQARAKVSMRLVADQDPTEIQKLFTKHVRALTPDTVQLMLRNWALAEPALVDREIPAMQAASKAYERGFGRTPVFMREGGSIPVVPLLKRALGLDTILMGFGLPDDRPHSPNERLYLPNFYKGIETIIYFLSEYAQMH